MDGATPICHAEAYTAPLQSLFGGAAAASEPPTAYAFWTGRRAGAPPPRS
jgi:hypothetical protein